jgi:xylose isomerase
MAAPKFATGLWVVGGTADRFNRLGYADFLSLRAKVAAAARVPGLQGVETHQSEFDDKVTAKDFVHWLKDGGLVCSCMNLDVWSTRQFKLGAFTNRDPNVRQQALDEAKRAVDLAREVGAPSVCLWNGADGWDYPFQADYLEQWNLEVDGIRKVAEYAAPDIKVALEYKLREPRNRMLVGDVGKALAIALEIGLPNLGVQIDFGHALMARESPGESVAILARHNKLFNVHFNESMRDWDDDMIPGTVHLWETLEFLYWCKVTDYEGWFGLDMFPYREDGVQAAAMAIRNLQAMWKLLDKIDMKALKKAQEQMDAVAVHEVVRRMVFV